MLKRLSNIIRKTNQKRILAILFVLIIFCLSTANFSPTLKSMASFLDSEEGIKNRILSFRKSIDDKYFNMLDFKGNILKNKGSYINLNGLIARIMGQPYMNERVKLSNGHLSYTHQIKKSVDEAIMQLTSLYREQVKNDKYFLFVLAPVQISNNEDLLPEKYKNLDFTHDNADQLLDGLKLAGIPVLDLRQEMINDGISHSDAFFVTNHHWKPETGFWAYTKILLTLVSLDAISAVEESFISIEEFNVKNYEDWFLGSSGKRTGKYYAGVDSFSVITPRIDTQVAVSIPSTKLEKKGSFAETALSMESPKFDYFSSSPYGIYGHGDKGFISYRNEEASNDVRILSIGDSFSNASFCFLPLVIRECDQIDFRHYEDDFARYYDEYGPDIVIVLVGAQGVASKNTTYNFFND